MPANNISKTSSEYKPRIGQLELPSACESHNILRIVLLPDPTKPLQMFTIHPLQWRSEYRIVNICVDQFSSGLLGQEMSVTAVTADTPDIMAMWSIDYIEQSRVCESTYEFGYLKEKIAVRNKGARHVVTLHQRSDFIFDGETPLG